MTEFEFEWVKTENGIVICMGDFCIRCDDEPKARKLAEEKLKTIIKGNNLFLTIISESDI